MVTIPSSHGPRLLADTLDKERRKERKRTVVGHSTYFVKEGAQAVVKTDKTQCCKKGILLALVWPNRSNVADLTDKHCLINTVALLFLRVLQGLIMSVIFIVQSQVEEDSRFTNVCLFT